MIVGKTVGLIHRGLTVRDLGVTTAFFVNVLGWDVIARNDSYPRTTVTDGALQLTLWQVQTDTLARLIARRVWACITSRLRYPMKRRS